MKARDDPPCNLGFLDLAPKVFALFEGGLLGQFGCTCYHPLFLFNQFGHLERCLLRHGNVHSSEDCRLLRATGGDLCAKERRVAPEQARSTLAVRSNSSLAARSILSWSVRLTKGRFCRTLRRTGCGYLGKPSRKELDLANRARLFERREPWQSIWTGTR
jgi:hypothetical protein